jgi:uncharacterized protein (DUF433 family)
MYKNIESTNGVCSGAPRIKNRRITVYNVIGTLYNGDSISEYAKDYEVEENVIKEAIEYCKSLACQTSNVYQYCEGCILRTLNEKEAPFNKDDYYEVISEQGDIITLKKDGKEIFLGTMEELINEECGCSGWEKAEALFEKYFSANPNL